MSNLLNLKIQSHRLVLNIIRKKHEISGAELSRLTSYKRSTLVYILRSLEKKGLIEISRIGESTSVGGKPPTLWKLVSNRGYIIGLELLPQQVRITIIDFSSTIIYQAIKEFDYDILQLKGLKRLINDFYQILESLHISKNKILGIGIGIPGLVNCETGTVEYSFALKFTNLDIISQLNKYIDVPVRIANDANAGALGIKWHHMPISNLPGNIVFLTINENYQGIGAGLILNNNLYVGSYGTAGEIDAITPDLYKAFQEGMNQIGKDKVKLAPDRFNNNIMIKDLIVAKKMGCLVSDFVLKKLIHVIAYEIVNLIRIINPELIVIGGDISNTNHNEILSQLTRDITAICETIFPNGIVIPNITFSNFGIFSVSIGGTALILEEIFS